MHPLRVSSPVLSGAVPLLARKAARAALDPWVKRLAFELVGDAQGLDAAARLLSAVQGRVRFEPERGEVFRSPRATWERGAGDCDDSATLLAALASAAGLPAELVPMGAGGAPTHVVARILGQWAETTLRGARLGEHPGAALSRLGPSILRRPRTMTKPSSRRALLGAPSNLSPEFVARAEEARGIVAAGWVLATGRGPTRFELLWGLIWSRIDTSWGRGWSAPCAAPEQCGCDCAGSNNWGAVHAKKGQPSCPWADRYPNGQSYCVGIRTYPSPQEGARDFVRHLVVLRPSTGAALARVAPVREVIEAMRDEKYFGGFCPKTTALGLPTSSEQCRREAVDLTVLRARAEANIICAALGWPKPRFLESDPPVAWYVNDPGRGSSGGGGGALAVAAVGALAVGAGFLIWRSQRKTSKKEG